MRKINQCIINDATLINKCFESEFFHLFRLGEGDFSKVFEAKDCIIHNENNVNFSRTIVHGELDGNDAYQIVLDSDIYLLDSERIMSLLDEPQILVPMNDLLFALYKSVLTEDFINKLQSDSFLDQGIKGVEKNNE